MPSIERYNFELPLIMLVACGAGWAGYAFATPPVHQQPVSLALLPADSSVIPIVRVFDDFECPACGRFEERLGKRLQELAAGGRIVLRYHHTPLPMHPISHWAAAGVLCAGDAESSRIARGRLHGDRSWLRASDPADAVAAMLAPNSSSAILLCMKSDSVQAILSRDADFGRRAGIHRVPTIWIGQRHVTFRSYQALLKYLERVPTQ